jgi:hypothetical protein
MIYEKGPFGAIGESAAVIRGFSEGVAVDYF